MFAACSKHEAKPPAPEPPDPKDIPANIDRIAAKALADTGVPSASVAAVVNGKVIYSHAYGDARLEPKTPATSQMRYSIGSISKQFTATAILLLAEDGKLSLDDRVSKFVPGLTRGDDITIRELLSHTSGYPDYAPEDYAVPEWLKPIDANQIFDRWARKPLEFEPGTRWQYSNTNFVIAGVICEKAAGVPLFAFLTERVFKKLGMTSVTDSDRARLTEPDPQGYFRRALAPLRASPHEGPGWMYAAGELAMTAEDLAKWDISVMDQTVLQPASYRQLETENLLASGAGTGYGLGIRVQLTNGHRELRHNGEVLGFVAANTILPDDKLAVAVLTNQDASSAADAIASQVRDALLRADNAPSLATDRVVKQALADLAEKRIDRAALTPSASAYFSDAALEDFASTLKPLGALQWIEQSATSKRGGMIGRRYRAHYADKSLAVSVYETPDGKLQQLLVDGDH
jgi:CubicO group peptidase (beta-lactamase class C family)